MRLGPLPAARGEGPSLHVRHGDEQDGAWPDTGGSEVAHCDLVHVRDSKAVPMGPELRIAAPAWEAFVAGV